MSMIIDDVQCINLSIVIDRQVLTKVPRIIDKDFVEKLDNDLDLSKLCKRLNEEFKDFIGEKRDEFQVSINSFRIVGDGKSFKQFVGFSSESDEILTLRFVNIEKIEKKKFILDMELDLQDYNWFIHFKGFEKLEKIFEDVFGKIN